MKKEHLTKYLDDLTELLARNEITSQGYANAAREAVEKYNEELTAPPDPVTDHADKLAKARVKIAEALQDFDPLIHGPESPEYFALAEANRIHDELEKYNPQLEQDIAEIDVKIAELDAELMPLVEKDRQHSRLMTPAERERINEIRTEIAGLQLQSQTLDMDRPRSGPLEFQQTGTGRESAQLFIHPEDPSKIDHGLTAEEMAEFQRINEANQRTARYFEMAGFDQPTGPPDWITDEIETETETTE